jgi:hypothetical protein
MVTRKSSLKKKEKPEEELGPKPRKVDSKLKLSLLEDAIKDGKLTAPVGSELIVERPHDGRKQKMVCTVREVDDKKVTTWDETLGRWFVFEPSSIEKHGILVKINPKE